jgi:hypothetical protein
VSTLAAAVFAVAAIGFAAWAIKRGNTIARNADAALVRERRITFELGVLERLADACGRYCSSGMYELLALIRLLPDEDLPRLRRKVERQEAAQGENLLDSHWTGAVTRRALRGRPWSARRT